jgi:hypothetical protein
MCDVFLAPVYAAQNSARHFGIIGKEFKLGLLSFAPCSSSNV